MSSPAATQPSRDGADIYSFRVGGREVDPKALAAKHKSFEADSGGCALRLSPDSPLVARIDGHCFSTFTKGFRKPFDRRIADAMVATAADLVTKYLAVTAYTFSDEITLVFPPPADGLATTMLFKGKLMKLSTLLAGYTSVRFAYHMQQQIAGTEGDHGVTDKLAAEEETAARLGGDSASLSRLASRLADPQVHFDARVFNVPTMADAAANLVWRSSFDCRRNSVSGLARQVLGRKSLQNCRLREMLALLEARGVSWLSMPGHFRYGAFIKKETYVKEAVNPKTGETVLATRHRTRSGSVDLQAVPWDAVVAFVGAKLWEAEHSLPRCITVAAVEPPPLPPSGGSGAGAAAGAGACEGGTGAGAGGGTASGAAAESGAGAAGQEPVAATEGAGAALTGPGEAGKA